MNIIIIENCNDSADAPARTIVDTDKMDAEKYGDILNLINIARKSGPSFSINVFDHLGNTGKDFDKYQQTMESLKDDGCTIEFPCHIDDEVDFYI